MNIRYEYLKLLFDPPPILLRDRKLLRNLRKESFTISEEEIYNNILIIQTYNTPLPF